jgi:single-strand DNA-binding protein
MLGGREGMGGGDEAGGGAPRGYARDSGGEGGARPAQQRPPAAKPAPARSSTGFDDMDDDIPF